MSSDDDQWGQDLDISQPSTLQDAPYQGGFQSTVPLPSPSSPPPRIPESPAWNPSVQPKQPQDQITQPMQRIQTSLSTSNWPNSNQVSQPFIPRNTVQTAKPPPPKSTNDWGQPQNRSFVQQKDDIQKFDHKDIPHKSQDSHAAPHDNRSTHFQQRSKPDLPPYKQDIHQNKQKYDKHLSVPPSPAAAKPQIQQPVKIAPKFTTPVDVKPPTKNQFMANCPKEFAKVIEKSVDSKGNFVPYSPENCVSEEYKELFAACGVLESCKPPAWWVHCDDLHVEIANYDLTNYGPQLSEQFNNEN